MRRPVRVSLLAVLSAATLVGGCGLKPDVADQLNRAGPGGLGAGSGELGAVGPDGQPLDGAGGTGDGTGSGPGGTGGTGGTGSGPGGTGASGPGSGPGAGPGGRGGSNGPVIGKTIRIGVHAPVTGAAAFPQRSFQNAVGVYAKYINDKGGIHGRKLEVFFEDDAFNPNTARNKCKYFAEQLKVFVIIGAAGSDQIDSCARYANSVGVPYISGGVHETRPGLGPLSALRTYFAVSLSYEQQAPMVARTAKSKVASVGLMVASNDSLNNFFAVQRGALQKSFGSNLKFAERVPKAIQSEAPSIAAKICNSGVKGVVWNASPSGLINVTKAMTCNVTFFGPGNTNGLNIVATGGCPQLNNARFFSSFPQLDAIDSMDPAFRPAYQKKNGSAPDDIGIAVWGIEKLLGTMLQTAGKDLSTQKFLATLSSGKTFSNGVYPPAKFGGGKKLGGTAMHLLRAECGSRQFKTEAKNVRP